MPTRNYVADIDPNADLSTALQQLINGYNATPAYTPKTSAQIRTQAEGEYQSYYDRLRLAAQQSQQRSDLALQQQRAGLQDTYDRMRTESQKSYNRAYSQADRQMLSRGMQRSSYTAQTLANLSQQGAEAQDAIGRQQAQAEGNIDAQRTQLAQQLAEQLMQYDSGQAADVLNRIRQLEDQEYERGNADAQYRNQLSTQIYEFMRQMEQDRIAQQQWNMTFNENQRQFDATLAAKAAGGSGSSSRRSGSGSGGGGTQTQAGKGEGAGKMTMDGFMGLLNQNYRSMPGTLINFNEAYGSGGQSGQYTGASGVKGGNDAYDYVITGLLRNRANGTTNKRTTNKDKGTRLNGVTYF